MRSTNIFDDILEKYTSADAWKPVMGIEKSHIDCISEGQIPSSLHSGFGGGRDQGGGGRCKRIRKFLLMIRFTQGPTRPSNRM